MNDGFRDNVAFTRKSSNNKEKITFAYWIILIVLVLLFMLVIGIIID